jgi:hypothetical protein
MANLAVGEIEMGARAYKWNGESSIMERVVDVAINVISAEIHSDPIFYRS